MDIAKIILPFGDETNHPKMIVLHAMGQYIHANQNVLDYYSSKNLELNRDYHAPEWLRALGYSAHQLIDPSGIRIKCREDAQGAWHARGFNEDSLGVEFLAKGIHTYSSFSEMIKEQWVTDNQYESGILLVRYWMDTYDIAKDQIKCHYELSPERKKDPGTGFPLEAFISDL